MAQVIKNVRVRLKLPECKPSAEKLNVIFEFDEDIAITRVAGEDEP